MEVMKKTTNFQYYIIIWASGVNFGKNSKISGIRKGNSEFLCRQPSLAGDVHSLTHAVAGRFTNQKLGEKLKQSAAVDAKLSGNDSPRRGDRKSNRETRVLPSTK